MNRTVFRLEIELDNDAFNPLPEREVSRILHEVGEQVRAGGLPRKGHTVTDINGNQVGTARVELERVGTDE